MRKINSKFVTRFISEPGAKLQNKDYFAFVELDQYAIYVVADGIDTDPDIHAAKLAVANIITQFSESPSLKKSRLKHIIRNTHKYLLGQNSQVRLKVSLTIMVTNYVKARYVVVGNTRFHLFRESYFKYQSKDQSLTQQLVNEEKVQLDKVAKHEERNNLYAYLGQDGIPSPSISKKFRLRTGDIVTLMTKGVWENVDSGELFDSIHEAKEAQEVVDHVEELMLSKQPEDLDNYTLATIFIDKTYINPKRKQRIKKIIAIMIPILILSIVIGSMIYFKIKKKNERINQMEYELQTAIQYVEDENYIRANEAYKEALKYAKQLKDTKKTEDIQGYAMLMDTLLTADKYYQDGAYQKALEQYDKAKVRAYYNDRIGEDYIEEQMEQAQSYLTVYDYINAGDKAFEQEYIAGAIEDYTKARDLAATLYFSEGKTEAQNKLDKVNAYKLTKQKEYEQEQAQAKEVEVQKAEEEKVKQEEEEQAKKEEKENKRETQLTAIEIEKQGDVGYSIGNYQDAKMYYIMAKQMYNEVEMYEWVSQVEQKIQLTNQQIANSAKEKAKADLYVQEADEKYKDKKLNEAKMLYLLAQDIYEKNQLLGEIKKIDNKIAVIDKLLEQESKKDVGESHT